MGRHSSGSEEETRSRKKKKHRKRSSSSSSSDGRTYSRKKSAKKSRSRSREVHSHSYEKRRRHRSSSNSSYSSRRKRSCSRSRDRGRTRKYHKSRTSRSRSRHRQRSRSRSSERSSRRRSRSRSYDRERGKGKEKSKMREERGKQRESTSKPSDLVNIKAGLEHLPPAEQAKARLQMVLQAAAKADEALRAKEKSEEEARKRKEEDLLEPEAAKSPNAKICHQRPADAYQSLLLDQAKREKEIEAIESDSFVPQMFRSSRDTKGSTESSETKHESAILGTGTIDPFDEAKESEIGLMPTTIKYLDDNCLAHPNLYIEKEEAELKWYKRLTSLRQEHLMGSPVA
ncbi:arginine/serine-rich coiled-coil 1 S homeolog isoform X2 [Xenopus laevis]|uniref:Arginine/serine-rich coiled-coil 1 S homeolog isoform X2 n=1 Tax=Xenopus laevis TaxID=8355 RepID=A0A8J0VJ44_XENLA|nr:arginine/serine-rich coiled-coil 1 S homeolog isoform X2 [Xenopus laevis]